MRWGYRHMSAGTHGGQKMAADPGSRSSGQSWAGTWTWVLCESSKCSAISPSQTLHFYKVTVMSQTTSIGGNKSTKITKDFDFHHPCVSARTNTCASIPNVRCSPSWVETVSEGKERLTGQTLISRENVENDSRRGLAFVSQSEIMELQFWTALSFSDVVEGTLGWGTAFKGTVD